MTPFGKEVAKALIERDMTQSDLAEQLGYSPTYVSFVLNGKKRPTPAVWEFLEQRGMTAAPMRAAFVHARGVLSTEGLSFEQVSELMAELDRIAPTDKESQ